MKKQKIMWFSLLLLFLASLFFLSCEKKSDEPSVSAKENFQKLSEAAQGTEQEIGKSESPKISETKKYKIAGIVFQEDQFMRLVQLGMKSVADSQKITLKEGNSLNSLSTEISLIDTYIAEKVDAIVITPLSKKGSIEALKRANEQGIKVITYNTDIEADFQKTFIESDQAELGYKTGQLAAEYIKANLNGKAKIAMLEFMSLSPEQSKGRVEGFKDGVKSIEGLEIEIVSEQDAWLAPQATNVVENILTANPNINIIWAANEGGTVGAVTAVNNKGFAGKVAVFGTDISKQLANFLLAKDGILQVVTGQQPFQMGITSMESAIKILNGEELPKRIVIPSVSYKRDDPTNVNEYLKNMENLEKK